MGRTSPAGSSEMVVISVASGKVARAVTRSPPPKGYTTVLGRSFGSQGGEEGLRHVHPALLVLVVCVLQLAAVAPNDGGVEAGRHIARGAARGHAEEHARLVDEIETLEGSFGRRAHRGARGRERRCRGGGASAESADGGAGVVDGTVLEDDEATASGAGARAQAEARTIKARLKRRVISSPEHGFSHERRDTRGPRPARWPGPRAPRDPRAPGAGRRSRRSRTTLQSTQTLMTTKSAGTSGYPGTRNGRGASGLRTRSTKTDATVSVENATIPNMAKVNSWSKLPLTSSTAETTPCATSASTGAPVLGIEATQRRREELIVRHRLVDPGTHQHGRVERA